MADYKFTNEELTKCIECCIKAESWGDCEKMKCPAVTRHGCRFYLRTDDDYENTIYIEILKDVLNLINRQKTDVAREIFEEIYKSVASKIPMEIRPIFKDDGDFDGGFINGKRDALLDVLVLIAELKKKYTEDNNNEN